MPPQARDLIRPATRCEIYPRDKHGISRKNIDPDALKIMYRLIRHGYKAYLVGGGVRDLLLNKSPKDFDIATDATPRKVKDLFRNSRLIGRRFKLIHVFFRGAKIIEVSTFRDVSDPIDPEDADSESELLITRDNRYGTEETDALRRDITINALFYDLSTFSIIDYVGGMRDLQARLIRVIGNPDVRFAEDPVRLIRVIRHAAKAGFAIEEQCLASLRRNAHLITKSSAVRVFEELKKDLIAGYTLPILNGLLESGLLSYLLPNLCSISPPLIGTGSACAHSLELADREVAQGQLHSPTVILSLLAYYSRETTPEAIDTLFQSSDEVSEHIARAFQGLAVPRRERERVELLIQAWLVLAKGQRMPGCLHLIQRLGLTDDVRDFFRLIGLEESLVRMPQRGFQNEETEAEGRSDFGQPRRRRRRGGRGRGGYSRTRAQS
ncbi:MAG: polynucleotide adenylyltransferase PcnB [Oligoflexia bacterium]|nr:polynucleotide adenylyltransferase PcnB [Oligoflexia bacterium]